MEHILEQWVSDPESPMWVWPKLILLIGGSIAVLGKSADWLVEEAVTLSEKSGIPKVIIGATIVSLGTTVPEAAVSVLAAFEGDPDLALGNAVGSIICDTGLILGLACLISPLQLPPGVVNRQGWIQLAAGFLLVLMCIPWDDPASAWQSGGLLPQWGGWIFLGLLAVYLILSIRWSRGKRAIHLEELETHLDEPVAWGIAKLIVSIALVIVSSHVLIPAVKIAAERLGIPQSIIAATLVAFGTSLPELVTAVTAARHGHGDLAVGNVVGADILNVLFVAGAAAAVTPAGLPAEPHFFQLLFPVMLAVLVVFRVGIIWSRDTLKFGFGLLLLAFYVAFLVLNFSHLIRDPAHL
jgi:cation:H+ antiporter